MQIFLEFGVILGFEQFRCHIVTKHLVLSGLLVGTFTSCLFWSCLHELQKPAWATSPYSMAFRCGQKYEKYKMKTRIKVRIWFDFFFASPRHHAQIHNRSTFFIITKYFLCKKPEFFNSLPHFLLSDFSVLGHWKLDGSDENVTYVTQKTVYISACPSLAQKFT